MAPFEALYSPNCRSPIGWFEPGEAKLYGTDLVKDALEKVKLIQVKLRITQSKQKSYAYQKVYDVSFMVGEKFLLKVSPMKVIMRFGKKGKLSPRFIDPFEVLRRVGELDKSLGYEEEPIGLVARQDCQLRSKRIFAVKVQWRSQPVEKEWLVRDLEEFRLKSEHLVP
ncbi:uncharacterized protein [Nicotiana sylvestris]|uniref:uncharacterized protein n=1 Tax=Nicotiana sylvestris TaxID=4096 RepID=UPI00388C4399